jgi:4-aminobutyrate aminotransferase
MGVVVLDRMHEAITKNSAFSGARGIGLMAAVDLPDMATRNRLLQDCFRKGLILLGAGERSIRICPPLVVTEEEIQLAVEIMLEAVSAAGIKPAQAA